MKSEHEELLPFLTPQERAEMDRLLKLRIKLWGPQPGPQLTALQSLADDIWYGGAAGGGKSDLVEGAAITEHQRSVIFRRHFKDLSWLEERAKQIVGTSDGFNGSTHTFRLANGRMIEFGALQYEDDWEKWQGIPHDLIAFDEVTQFPKKPVKTLIAWNRTTTPGQRCRAIYTFNPPTSADGLWVLDELLPWLDPDHPNPAMPGELRFTVRIDDEEVEVPNGDVIENKGEKLFPRSRTFIPAKLSDNKYLGDDYRQRLQSLPEPLRSQMLYGDMKIGVKDDEWQAIPSAWIDASFELWESIGPEGPKDAEGKRLPMSGMGVDVARGGDDRTAIAKAYGRWVAHLKMIPGAQTPSGRAVVNLMKAEWEDEAPIAIDVVGVGSSPYDLAREDDMRVYGVHAAGASHLRDKSRQFGFMNVRAELIWKLREALDPENPDRIALPPDKELKQELTAARYEIVKGGIAIRSKDEIREKLGRSPDKADTVALLMRAIRMSL
jgi:probable HAF family extracellular repeat protein